MPVIEDKCRRKNGLEFPWHYLQIATWILFPTILVHYFAFLMPLLWSNIADRVLVTFLFCFCCITAVVGGYITCSIDPADDMVLKADEDQTPPGGKCSCFQNVTAVAANEVKEDEQIYCYVCELSVHESSKHCGTCQKCILRFDHHCKWLNTCVGAKNYRYFLVVLGSVTVMTSISLLLSIAYVVECYSQPHMFHKRVENANYGLTQRGSGAVAIASVIVLGPLVALVYQLASFHSLLVYRGITTYDFIVQEQKRLREKEQAKNAAKSEKQRKSRAEKEAKQPQNANSAHANATSDNTRGDIEMPAHDSKDIVEKSTANNNGLDDEANDEDNEVAGDDPASEYFEREQLGVVDSTHIEKGEV